MSAASVSALGKRLFSWAAAEPPSGSGSRLALWWLLRTIVICRREAASNFLTIRASALTFTVLLSLVPALAISTAVYKGFGGEGHLRLAAHRYLDELDSQGKTAGGAVKDKSGQNGVVDSGAANNSPSEGTDASVIGRLRAAVDNIFDYAEKINFTGLGLVGLAGLLFSVVMVFGYLEDALNSIWHVQKGRSLLRKITDYLAVLLLLPLSVNIALAASALQKSPTLAAALRTALPFPWLQTVFIKLLPFVGLTLTLLFIYRIFPKARVQNGAALAGAALASACWLAYQNICISLQIGLNNLNAIYGSFAALPLFCAWLNGALLILLIGAQFAYACQHARGYAIAPAGKTLAHRLDTALAIMRAAQEGFAARKPPDGKSLAAMFPHLPADLLTESIAELEQARLLYRSVGGELLPVDPALNQQEALETLFGRKGKIA
ncbi:MAG: YihY/virulence factor BrkB family protein [Desulfobulbaceae bacterium]|jgi:membrane protein|nr:YihY/virulence factor BrkB family protein [Desulfobulbaceae bacterium]